ncbi:protein-L-isoaspartate O-methyltransferase family protein [Streptomyces sp. MS19]|uniref:protein-L-isoaspartate O-methyltransferase family protein n=1 Tax=Streptomyces sp. MS19 TaxID=3385972 RepID=UPI0039A09237
MRSEAVSRAVAAVPRHAFIPGYYSGGTRIAADPTAPTAELLGLAYANRGIMTHLPGDAAGTYSSASQPSVVTRMLDRADLQPGHRVLEIGSGTGYNAALVRHITGAPVVTVEASAVVADEARSALAATGTTGVTVHTGDGLAGRRDGGPYDRIVVTCGVAGIATAWLRQLAPGGVIVAPLALGGLHPLTRVTIDRGQPRAVLLASADFMAATGALYERAAPSPSATGTALPEPDPAAARTVAELDPHSSYIDLWLYLALHDGRTTCAGGAHAGCALTSPGEPPAAVYLRPDGVLLPSSGARRLADDVVRHAARWTALGRPALTAWHTRLAPSGDRLHVPTRWGVRSSRGW